MPSPEANPLESLLLSNPPAFVCRHPSAWLMLNSARSSSRILTGSPMRHARLCDLAILVGVASLALMIGQGRQESARARERSTPLLWELSLSDPTGRVLVKREAYGQENQRLSLNDPSVHEAPVRGAPNLSLSLLPLGLPGGALDVELELRLDGRAAVPLRGLHLSPGQTISLGVPGSNYVLSLRALRLDGKAPRSARPVLVS